MLGRIQDCIMPLRNDTFYGAKLIDFPYQFLYIYKGCILKVEMRATLAQYLSCSWLNLVDSLWLLFWVANRDQFWCNVVRIKKWGPNKEEALKTPAEINYESPNGLSNRLIALLCESMLFHTCSGAGMMWTPLDPKQRSNPCKCSSSMYLYLSIQLKRLKV